MADVAVNIKVQADVNALTAIKKELKEMKALALNGDGAAAKRVAELTDKLEDLKDETKSLKGSGVERLTASFSLLTDGLLNFDTDKIKTGLKGIGGAMSAIPIFLLIEGVKLLIDNFDIVTDFAKSFTAAAKEQKIALNELNTGYHDLANNLDEIAFKQKELTRNIDTANKLAIESAKQRGASAKEINALEVKGNEDKLGILKKAEENYRKQKEFADSQYVKALKTNDEEAIKKAKEILDQTTSAYKSSIDSRKDAEAGLTTFAAQKQTEAYEKSKEINKQKLELAKKLQADEADRMNAAIDKEEADAKKLKETRERAIDELQQLQIKQNQEKAQQYLDEEKKAKEQSDKLIAIKKQENDTKVQIEKQSLQSAQILSELFFQAQLSAAEGDEKKQLEIKKKAFEINKAFQAGQAGIDGVRATLSAYATAPPGFKLAAAISAGIFATAQVAKILSAKFNAGTSAVPSSNIGGSASGGGAPLGGQIQSSSSGQAQQSTTYDQNGKQTGGWISVEEINKTQKRVATMSEQARF